MDLQSFFYRFNEVEIMMQEIKNQEYLEDVSEETQKQLNKIVSLASYIATEYKEYKF